MNMTTNNTMQIAEDILVELGAEGGKYFGYMLVNLGGQREIKITTQDNEGHLRFTVLNEKLIEAEIDVNTNNRQIITAIIAALVK